MRENCTSGSAQGASGNGRSYCEIALGKAQRILQGESPCRVRSNQPPVSSVDLVEELGN